MKTALILSFLFMMTSLNAQKKYLNSQFMESEDSRDAAYYRISSLINDTIVEKTYFINDTLYEIRQLDKVKFRSREGITREYYPNGKLKYTLHYQNNLLNGEVRGFYENGGLKRIDYYKGDLLLSGKCFGINGQDTTYIAFEKQAIFMGGGLETFYQAVIRNIKYPRLAIENGVGGRVIVGFTVNAHGEVVNAKAVVSPDEMLSRAAEEAIMKTGRWEPAEREGKKCAQSFYLPLNFNLGE